MGEPARKLATYLNQELRELADRSPSILRLFEESFPDGATIAVRIPLSRRPAKPAPREDKKPAVRPKERKIQLPKEELERPPEQTQRERTRRIFRGTREIEKVLRDVSDSDLHAELSKNVSRIPLKEAIQRHYFSSEISDYELETAVNERFEQLENMAGMGRITFISEEAGLTTAYSLSESDLGKLENLLSFMDEHPTYGPKDVPKELFHGEPLPDPGDETPDIGPVRRKTRGSKKLGNGVRKWYKSLGVPGNKLEKVVKARTEWIANYAEIIPFVTASKDSKGNMTYSFSGEEKLAVLLGYMDENPECVRFPSSMPKRILGGIPLPRHPPRLVSRDDGRKVSVASVYSDVMQLGFHISGTDFGRQAKQYVTAFGAGGEPLIDAGSADKLYARFVPVPPNRQIHGIAASVMEEYRKNNPEDPLIGRENFREMRKRLVGLALEDERITRLLVQDGIPAVRGEHIQEAKAVLRHIYESQYLKIQVWEAPMY